MDETRKQAYFAELAPQYHVLTGDTTKDILIDFLNNEHLGLSSSSIVHDNGSGPGTATQALIAYAANHGISPQIIATDYSSGMLQQLRTIKSAGIKQEPRWELVSEELCDSAKLDLFPDSKFTHSINNFSLFTMHDPVQCLAETYRTLRPGGIAVVLLWRRYAVQDLLASAQDRVRGKGFAAANAVPVNGPQYYEEGVVEGQMIEAGFVKNEHMRTISTKLLLDEGEKWDGLLQYLTSSSVAEGSTRGWTTEQKQQWPSAVLQAMLDEKQERGGIEFLSWITVARK